MLFKTSVVVILMGAIAAGQTVTPNPDIAATVARAAAAYYEARFDDALAILAPLNTALETESDRIEERVTVKLHLGLAHIGLNQLTEARERFSELYALKPDFVLDRANFAPKVLMVFDEARASREQTKCRLVCERVDDPANSSIPPAILEIVEAAPECSCMARKRAKAADEMLTAAVEDYKRRDLSQALSKVQTALKLNPNDSLAAQYLELIQENLELSMNVIKLQWRAHFDARDFPKASESYRQLLSANGDGDTAAFIDEVRNEYRRSMTSKVQSWRQACAAQDIVAMDSIRMEAIQLLPDQELAQDLFDQMTTCVANPPTLVGSDIKSQSPAAPEPPRECIANTSEVAMMRLRKQVDLQLPPEFSGKRAIKIRAYVRIDDRGNTSVYGLQGGDSRIVNRAVVTALRDWKFYPAKVGDHARCVETELHISFNP
jgi:tetratricopeptide (TPR) repeat protein